MKNYNRGIASERSEENLLNIVLLDQNLALAAPNYRYVFSPRRVISLTVKCHGKINNHKTAMEQQQISTITIIWLTIKHAISCITFYI